MSVFSKIPEENILFRGKYFFLIRDGYPCTPGHTLIISNRETPDYFSLSPEEANDLHNMIELARVLIEETSKPQGFNIGMNCGELAGQTVSHFHCHVIPRYKGDMDDPTGGVRHSVAGKGYYDRNIPPNQNH